ncbi:MULTISPECIES: molybdenum cofactor guanylyltransferase [Haloferax]|uniref:Probable molybdenum cofactor guanylyltransferase n=2 Tax=Haloferax TaxID=2251 RepID=A0A6G1Z024_9EURY|nr:MULTISPECIES: molybdenum cofactor guanylyltransferase [Haloferax]KAB1187246.1 molybdenum cofactor guanylyltransferase [Haloferax sp. CBA1149]MRW79890.1 NTP transferase domain-containing protein [Haloferax marinisediminis]
MSESAADVTGVVLAGGSSSRFEDGNKALATLDGETLVERVVRALSSATKQPPLVAVRTEAQRDRFSRTLPSAWDVRFVMDDDELTGPLAGLLSACETASTRWLFTVGCDMPLVDASTVTGTFERATRTAACHPCAVVPVSRGQYEPLHAVYRRESVIDCRDRLSVDDGFGALLTELGDVDYVDIDELPQVGQASVTNVNTVAELERVAADVE